MFFMTVPDVQFIHIITYYSDARGRLQRMKLIFYVLYHEVLISPKENCQDALRHRISYFNQEERTHTRKN